VLTWPHEQAEDHREDARVGAQAAAGSRTQTGSDRNKLTDIAEGKRKQVDALWWDKLHAPVNRDKLDKLQRLADPARNPSEHERTVAARKFASFKARTAPGSHGEAPETDWKKLLAERVAKVRAAQWKKKRQPASDVGVNKGAAAAPPKLSSAGVNKGAGVNKKPKKRTDTRRRKGDRHKPGYMRDYMRKWRAAAKQTRARS
jgi:hypothetical protein